MYLLLKSLGRNSQEEEEARIEINLPCLNMSFEIENLFI